MRKTLEILHRGNLSAFAVSKLSRATLYGSKRRAAMDAQGRECEAAALTRDGRFILPKGGTTLVYLDERGDALDRGELAASGGVAAALKMKDVEPFACEPAVPTEILDSVTTRVYRLAPVSISQTLDAALRDTSVCRLAQGSHDADDPERAFLVRNDSGYFLLVGKRTDFDFLGPDESDITLADEAMDDDLDFAMM